MKKSFLKLALFLLTAIIFASCGSEKSVACDCVEEFDTMRFNSQSYIDCVDLAIANNASDNPYDYFKNICNN